MDCSDVTSVTIDAGGSVTASAVVDQHETCDGDCDGEATGTNSYEWSTGATTATITATVYVQEPIDVTGK